ncbi:hypothetical protein G7046_g7265 [Stylonectria norvegica]|nr:hypothetical protein G7046_g7265 [Stylonectria norvegica]
MGQYIGTLFPLRFRLWLGKQLYKPLTSRVVRVSQHRVIKGPCGPPEVEAMQYITKNTTIPIPKVYAVHTTPDQHIYVEMEYIQGEDLDTAWRTEGRLSQDQKKTIFADIKEYISILRELQPPAGDLVASALGNPAYDCRIGARFFGPFNHRDFHSLTRGQLRKEDIVTVLVPRNVIVRNGRVAAIIDWGFAGWYPEYWEFTKGHYDFFPKEDWTEYFRQAIPRYDIELIAERALWELLPDPGTPATLHRDGIVRETPGSKPSAKWQDARAGRQLKDLCSRLNPTKPVRPQSQQHRRKFVLSLDAIRLPSSPTASDGLPSKAYVRRAFVLRCLVTSDNHQVLIHSNDSWQHTSPKHRWIKLLTYGVLLVETSQHGDNGVQLGRLMSTIHEECAIPIVLEHSIMRTGKASMYEVLDILVMHGMGGRSKTQLAIAYMKRHRSGGSTRDATSFSHSFKDAAQRTLPTHPGLNYMQNAVADEDGDISLVVKKQLEEPMNYPWLFIYAKYEHPKIEGDIREALAKDADTKSGPQNSVQVSGFSQGRLSANLTRPYQYISSGAARFHSSTYTFDNKPGYIIIGAIPSARTRDDIGGFLKEVPLPRKNSNPQKSCVTWVGDAIRKFRDETCVDDIKIGKFLDWALVYADQRLWYPGETEEVVYYNKETEQQQAGKTKGKGKK